MATAIRPCPVQSMPLTLHQPSVALGHRLGVGVGDGGGVGGAETEADTD